MACKENERKCFTFLWKVENISFCFQKQGEKLESPPFVVNAIEQTKWKLGLFPRGNTNGDCIGYFLRREADSKGADIIEIKYELEFIAKDGSVLVSHYILQHTFPKGQDYGFHAFVKRDDVFISKRSKFLFQNTLRARCKIWGTFGEMTDSVRCTAYTRIGFEKTSFLWNVRNFSTLKLGEKATYLLKSIKNDAPFMFMYLSLTVGLTCDEIIRFELFLQDQSIKFFTLRLSLIDSSGNRVECNEDEFWFDSLHQFNQFMFFFTKKKLLAKKSIYLPNDVLSLSWELAFSKAVVLEETEEVLYGSAISEINIPDDRNVNDETQVLLSHTLYDSLKSLYDKKFLCDVQLKTNTSVFPAHKIILSASSPVFNAMFSSDMEEKDSDCVIIDDLTDDAVHRMLSYIYTARVEDVSWESASHLYVAADKYAILSLKDICSSYLKENLSPSNACEVLLLADFHADDKMKSDVQAYIQKHDMDIINSDEWKVLVETNMKLAMETLCNRYK